MGDLITLQPSPPEEPEKEGVEVVWKWVSGEQIEELYTVSRDSGAFPAITIQGWRAICSIAEEGEGFTITGLWDTRDEKDWQRRAAEAAAWLKPTPPRNSAKMYLINVKDTIATPCPVGLVPLGAHGDYLWFLRTSGLFG